MMSDDFGEQERCAVCGKAADGDRWFCHIYNDRGRVSLCSPACAEVYLHPTETVGIAAVPQSWDGPKVPWTVM